MASKLDKKSLTFESLFEIVAPVQTTKSPVGVPDKYFPLMELRLCIEVELFFLPMNVPLSIVQQVKFLTPPVANSESDPNYIQVTLFPSPFFGYPIGLPSSESKT